MSNAANASLVEPWKDLWNGDLSQTEKIIADDFVAHAAPLTGTGTDEIRGREALNAWVSGIRAILADLDFVIDVGPITDDEHLVVRTLRIAEGKLAEYWANADSLLFYQQLSVREVPARG
jgi:hypothetical protein